MIDTDLGEASPHMKRFLSDASERTALHEQLVTKMASLMERTVDELQVAVAAAPSATLTDLGLNSAMGIAIKGWIFHELEAELTTFQVLKQPLDQVVEAIEGARRQDVGAKNIPELGSGVEEPTAVTATPAPPS